uniref:Uncharacterized protein n=1 Tax=Octopus bimaculoides TaxID=37653 RepID=A0A0L8GFE4_OCTBM
MNSSSSKTSIDTAVHRSCILPQTLIPWVSEKNGLLFLTLRTIPYLLSIPPPPSLIRPPHKSS